MPDTIQAVRGVWKCNLKALRAPWVLLLDPPTPVLSAGRRRLFLSARPVEGLTAHWGLVQVCFDGPCVKLLFYKNLLPACHNQELLCNSPEVHHFAARECTPSAESTGPDLRSLGLLLSGEALGCFQRARGGAVEWARRPGASPVQAAAPLGPRLSCHVLPTGPKAGVSLHTRGRPQKRGCWGPVGVAAGRVYGLSPHCFGGSPAPE